MLLIYQKSRKNICIRNIDFYLSRQVLPDSASPELCESYNRCFALCPTAQGFGPRPPSSDLHDVLSNSQSPSFRSWLWCPPPNKKAYWNQHFEQLWTLAFPCGKEIKTSHLRRWTNIRREIVGNVCAPILTSPRWMALRDKLLAAGRGH